jgi:ABC-type glutathione transport system ATPase component
MSGMSAGGADEKPVLDLRDVSQQVRGGELIPRGISLTNCRGELVAIVGGSGTGKTTLLDAMSGLRPAPPHSARRRWPATAIRSIARSPPTCSSWPASRSPSSPPPAP